MMTRAYDINYLDDAMSNVGAMLDYAVNSCGEDISQFYARFLSSGIARAIFRSNPKYLAGMSGIELASLVADRTGEALPEKSAYIDMGSPEYWAGWTMAYLSWYMCMDFATLQSRGLGVRDIYDRYPALHEADLSKAVSYAVKRMEEFQAGGNLLKRARNNAGLTQEELADLSGSSLRVIRSYEQGQRALDNAGVENVRHLSRVLGCRIEDLIPINQNLS